MIQMTSNNPFQNLGHNRENRYRSTIRRITPASSFLKKRRDSCTLPFIRENTSVDKLIIRARDPGNKSGHSFSSLTDTESRPVASFLYNWFRWDKMCNWVTRWKLKQLLVWLTISSKKVPTTSISLDRSGPISAKNLLKPSAISVELFILAPLSSNSLIAALSDLRRVTSSIVSQVLREFLS